MITQEPIIHVGIYDGCKVAKGAFGGTYEVNNSTRASGDFNVRIESNTLVMINAVGKEIARDKEIVCAPLDGKPFVLRDVTIGVKFHWERKEDQTFEGALKFVLRDDGTITAINDVPLESYLKSVISSEMSATAPRELLRAHAITSRSWLVAMLERVKIVKSPIDTAQKTGTAEEELIRWYTREDHDIYDVCADDHCQRYQGVTKIISDAANRAIETTRGDFLVYNNEVCDARYYKACGGLTEEFSNAWEDIDVPYLKCVSDASTEHPVIQTEIETEKWILSEPEAYCNTNDGNILKQVLPSFDQETTDFYRWKVEYKREELEQIIKDKSGIDFGTLLEFIPIKRGTSGRLEKLKIVGTKKSLIVGKELEIRRWLSKSHLYSGAFVVKTERGTDNLPKKFILHGAGWGHGVGLCQIGASVMAVKGFDAEMIVKHYFRGAEVRKLY